MTARPNLLSPEHFRDPYALYAALRGSPIQQVEPNGMWAVSRYEDVVAVLKDPQRFSSTQRLRNMPEWLERSRIHMVLVTMDPPEHTKLRGLVGRAFAPPALARLEAKIRDKARALTRSVLDRREVDFVSEFALRLPAFVIGELLGLDPSLHDPLKRWVDDMLAVSAGRFTPERIARIQQSHQDMERYMCQVLEERRQRPADDMISDLLRAEVDGRRLDEGELLGFFALLLIAGLETTVNLLGNTMICLARHPDVLPRVRADLGRVPALVEEVLRFEAPVQLTARTALSEVELAGVRLPANAHLAVLLGSACRDERHFERPDQFDIDREKPANLPFGHGIHFCLGAPLARLEARLGLEALLPSIRDFHLKTPEVSWAWSLSVRGPTALPLEVVPA